MMLLTDYILFKNFTTANDGFDTPNCAADCPDSSNESAFWVSLFTCSSPHQMLHSVFTDNIHSAIFWQICEKIITIVMRSIRLKPFRLFFTIPFFLLVRWENLQTRKVDSMTCWCLLMRRWSMHDAHFSLIILQPYFSKTIEDVFFQ